MGVSLTGCCDTAGRTLWCDGGQLYCINCKAQGQTCGWSATYEFYDCDQVGEDPTGYYPIGCPGSCVPNCTGRVCGTDGCGGTCGACGDGKFCIDGGCFATPPACYGSASPISSECGDVNYVGCCDAAGKTLWCEGAALYCVDCVGVGNPACGWDSDYLSYDCGTYGEADPSGQYPLSCGPPPCVPDCYLKACGDNGCGDVCGTCNTNQVCNASFQCENQVCVPDCAGRYCGPNGCGGSCGECAATETCNASGQCQPTVCDPTCSGKQCGGDGCGGSCGICGDYSQCVSGLCICDIPCTQTCCAPGQTCYVDTCCTADCSQRQCGDNGCGGQCGTCPTDYTCDGDGICQPPPCQPDCADKICGDDGCGGLCGQCGLYSACVQGKCLCEFNCAGNCCAPDAKCVNGQCCTPDCTNTQCGTDGCNGSCGACQAGLLCKEGQCVQPSPDPNPETAPDVVQDDLSQPDTHAPQDTTPEPDLAADTHEKDQSATDHSPVDQESDPGNGIIIPADQLDPDTQRVVKTTGCSSSTASTATFLPLLLLLLFYLFLSRISGFVVRNRMS